MEVPTAPPAPTAWELSLLVKDAIEFDQNGILDEDIANVTAGDLGDASIKARLRLAACCSIGYTPLVRRFHHQEHVIKALLDHGLDELAEDASRLAALYVYTGTALTNDGTRHLLCEACDGQTGDILLKIDVVDRLKTSLRSQEQADSDTLAARAEFMAMASLLLRVTEDPVGVEDLILQEALNILHVLNTTTPEPYSLAWQLLALKSVETILVSLYRDAEVPEEAGAEMLALFERLTQSSDPILSSSIAAFEAANAVSVLSPSDAGQALDYLVRQIPMAGSSAKYTRRVFDALHDVCVDRGEDGDACKQHLRTSELYNERFDQWLDCDFGSLAHDPDLVSCWYETQLFSLEIDDRNPELVPLLEFEVPDFIIYDMLGRASRSGLDRPQHFKSLEPALMEFFSSSSDGPLGPLIEVVAFSTLLNLADSTETQEKCVERLGIALQDDKISGDTSRRLYDASDEFRFADALTGIVSNASTTLQHLKTTQRDFRRSSHFNNLIGVLVNLSRHSQQLPDLAKRLADEQVVDLLASLIDVDQVDETSLTSALGLAYLVGHIENHPLLAVKKGILTRLCRALDFALAGKPYLSTVWATAEILQALASLSLSDANKPGLLETNALDLSCQVLEDPEDDTEAAEFAAKLVANLMFSLLEAGDIPELVTKTLQAVAATPNPTDDPHLCAAWKYAKLALFSAEHLSDNEDQTKSSGKHIMISYPWAHQEQMLRVHQTLADAGMAVWIDVEQMSASLLESMGRAVENAHAMIVCVCEEYKDSEACRTEAEYAYRLKIPVVPVLVQKDYVADGWLGALIGSKLYFDLNLGDEAFNGLVTELRRMNAPLADLSKPPSPTRLVSSTPYTPRERISSASAGGGAVTSEAAIELSSVLSGIREQLEKQNTILTILMACVVVQTVLMVTKRVS